MTLERTRWLDDPGVPDALRRDLAGAAREPLPPADPAGLARLEAALRGPGGGGGGGAPAPRGALWTGAAIGVGIGVVVCSVMVLLPSAPPAQNAPGIAASGASPAVASAAPVEIVAPSPEPAASESAHVSSSARAVATASAAPDPNEELAMWIETKEKAARDPAAALALADEGQRRFPRGTFAQEREAIAILMLTKLGRTDEARPRARRFVASHPASPYASRLRAIAEAP